MEFWQDWPQPWSREQCRDRYVRGSKIGLRTLAEQSGRSLGTLGGWSSEDDWQVQREQFQDKKRSRTDEKIVEQVSQAIAEEAADVAAEHFNAHRSARKIAEFYLNAVSAQLKRLTHPEMLEEALKAVSPLSLNFISLTLDRSIQGERQALGMEYDDINKAIAAIERTGLKVVAPDDATLERLLTGQESKESHQVNERAASLVEIIPTSETA